jgi:outer membrane protein assembly factor BamB
MTLVALEEWAFAERALLLALAAVAVNPTALAYLALAREQLKTQTPDVPTPVIHDGLVYLCRENGVLICLDAVSGEQIYEERVVSDRHRASPVVAGGNLYMTSRRGVVAVIKIGRSFEVIAKNSLDEPISAMAISDDRIYLRVRCIKIHWQGGNRQHCNPLISACLQKKITPALDFKPP